MKKLIYIAICIFVMTIAGAFGKALVQQSGNSDNYSQKNLRLMKESCITTAVHIPKESRPNFCNCVMNKVTSTIPKKILFKNPESVVDKVEKYRADCGVNLISH